MVRARTQTYIGLLVIIFLITGCSPTHFPAGKGGPADPSLVFATIADSHISISPDNTMSMKALSISRELLATYVDDINKHSPPVDFVIHLGDITNQALPWEFANASRIMNRLDCPHYSVLGNHDNFRGNHKRGWRDFAGRDSTSYTFDHAGFHFVVIDCTPDPYDRAKVGCGKTLRTWVAQDLAANADRPTFIISHYNMWERTWNARFDTTRHYREYKGMPELRQILEEAGNVVAVINGHVHANRVEVHNGIHYIDVGATLVGRPSIRYFHLFPDRVDVTYRYISDEALLDHVASLCPQCGQCFDPLKVCDFIDGDHADKEFTIPIRPVARIRATGQN